MRAYIETIGCQMNVYDATRIENALQNMGYTLTPDLDAADLILLNSCAIREKAQQKTYSFLGRLTALKEKKPSLLVVLAGCVAQQDGAKARGRLPVIDIVLGTHAIFKLPQMIEDIRSGKKKACVDVAFSTDIARFEAFATVPEKVPPARFVTIMQGCDNFCTYCVVPHVRGREMSRPPENILKEVEATVKAGAKEVTLLGQNVNSYGKKEGFPSFPELLADISKIDGLERIRFTTSHPKDLSDELIDAFATNPKLCGHIHLPVQSGSTDMLHRMNRHYTRDEYLGRVRKLRMANPGIALTTDIIVGFPGETEKDFLETVSLLDEVLYDGLFAFMYSDRKSAPARAFSDKVPEVEKKKRIHIILKKQEQITLEKLSKLVGTTQTILIEGESPRAINDTPKTKTPQYMGRTLCNRIVHAVSTTGAPQIGDVVSVHIERAFSHSLYGRMELV